MEKHQGVSRNPQNSKRDFNPKRIIIKNKFAKIYPKRDYLIIVDDEELIIGYRYILEVYISVHNSVPLKYLYKLAKKKKVFLIDEHNYLVGEVKIGISSGLWYSGYKKSG